MEASRELCVSLYVRMLMPCAKMAMGGTASLLTEVASMQAPQPTGLRNHETVPQTYESSMCKLEHIVCASRVLVPCGSVCVSRVPFGSVCLVWVHVRCAVRLRMTGGGEHQLTSAGD